MSSQDGTGSADHDQPFTFGRHLSTDSPGPFTVRQVARLLIVRGRIRAIVPIPLKGPFHVHDD